MPGVSWLKTDSSRAFLSLHAPPTMRLLHAPGQVLTHSTVTDLWSQSSIQLGMARMRQQYSRLQPFIPSNQDYTPAIIHPADAHRLTKRDMNCSVMH